MAILYHPSLDPSRVYYGTDTRALRAALRRGAGDGLAEPQAQPQDQPQARRNRSTGSASSACWSSRCMIWRTGEYSPFLYRGGFVLLSLAHGAGRRGAGAPGLPARPDRSAGKPLRWIGVRSYGIYLWHFPIIVLTTPAGHRQRRRPAPRASSRSAAILGVAALSWKLRRGADPPRGARPPAEARIQRGRLDGAPPSTRAGWAIARRGRRRPRRRRSPGWPASTRSRRKARTRGWRKRPPPGPPGRRRSPRPRRPRPNAPPAKPSSTSATRPRRG